MLNKKNMQLAIDRLWDVWQEIPVPGQLSDVGIQKVTAVNRAFLVARERIEAMGDNVQENSESFMRLISTIETALKSLQKIDLQYRPHPPQARL